MTEQTLLKIKQIEDQAIEIVKAAEKKAALAQIKAQETQANEIETLKKALEQETKQLIETEKLKAEQEAKQIEAKAQEEIIVLRTNTPAKIPQAKKEILKCL